MTRHADTFAALCAYLLLVVLVPGCMVLINPPPPQAAPTADEAQSKRTYPVRTEVLVLNTDLASYAEAYRAQADQTDPGSVVVLVWAREDIDGSILYLPDGCYRPLTQDEINAIPAALYPERKTVIIKVWWEWTPEPERWSA